NEYMRIKEMQLKASNQQLVANEEQLKKTSGDLIGKVEDLEKFKAVTVGRELKMVGLKKEINELLKMLGKEPRYDIER
ncbi:MAG: hypothetical protein ABH858_02980, partial [Candidatus Omnitrophota bacterium]